MTENPNTNIKNEDTTKSKYRNFDKHETKLKETNK